MQVGRATVLGAAITPVVTLAYFAALGLSPPPIPTTLLGPTTWLLWCLGAVGVLAAGGAAVGLRVVPLLAVLLVVLTPWAPMLAEIGAADGATDLLVPLLGSVHVLAILATVEAVTRPGIPNPDWSMPRPVVAGGLALAATYLLVRASVFGVDAVTGPGYLLRNTWFLAGQLVVGATAAYAWQRHGTVLPAVTVLAAVAVAAAETQAMVAGEAALAAAITPLTLYAVAWAPLLSVLVAVAALEAGLRRRWRGVSASI